MNRIFYIFILLITSCTYNYYLIEDKKYDNDYRYDPPRLTLENYTPHTYSISPYWDNMMPVYIYPESSEFNFHFPNIIDTLYGFNTNPKLKFNLK